MSHKFVYIHGYIYIWYSPSKLCPNLFEKTLKKIYPKICKKNTVNTGKGTKRVGTGAGAPNIYIYYIYIYIYIYIYYITLDVLESNHRSSRYKNPTYIDVSIDVTIYIYNNI